MGKNSISFHTFQPQKQTQSTGHLAQDYRHSITPVDKRYDEVTFCSVMHLNTPQLIPKTFVCVCVCVCVCVQGRSWGVVELFSDIYFLSHSVIQVVLVDGEQETESE